MPEHRQRDVNVMRSPSAGPVALQAVERPALPDHDQQRVDLSLTLPDTARAKLCLGFGNDLVRTAPVLSSYQRQWAAPRAGCPKAIT